MIGARRSENDVCVPVAARQQGGGAFGSDWFVAPPTPLEGIYAAVTRRTLDDKHPDGWVPTQKITVEEALWAYTRAGALATFQEREKGMIATGMLADLTMIDRDLRTISPVQIRRARIIWTIVGGTAVFKMQRSRPRLYSNERGTILEHQRSLFGGTCDARPIGGPYASILSASLSQLALAAFRSRPLVTLLARQISRARPPASAQAAY